MWKDFFYYSKSERRSIIVLSSMGILLLVFGLWSHYGVDPDYTVVDSLRTDSFCIQVYKKRAFRDSMDLAYQKRYVRPVSVLTKFDPNQADSAAFCRLGLPSFLARRIVNYRKKGGVFQKAEDFSRLYGLSQEQYERLKPYIVIDTLQLAAKRMALYQQQHRQQTFSFDTLHPAAFRRDTSFLKYPEGTVVDLNTADTTQLKRIPRIGSGLAKMILAYRNQLGGYSSVEQLQEIAHLDTTINKWFEIKTGVYRPLRVNHVGLDQLRNHPYMNFYKAKVIIEYRRKRGKIKGLPQLSMFQEFTEKDLQRLQPYLDFN